MLILLLILFFFFNDTATTEIYTLSLHDALPILDDHAYARSAPCHGRRTCHRPRSEEHTSELQSRSDLVCRLLLEKKKKLRNAAIHGELSTYRGSHEIEHYFTPW